MRDSLFTLSLTTLCDFGVSSLTQSQLTLRCFGVVVAVYVLLPKHIEPRSLMPKMFAFVVLSLTRERMNNIERAQHPNREYLQLLGDLPLDFRTSSLRVAGCRLLQCLVGPLRSATAQLIVSLTVIMRTKSMKCRLSR